MLYKKLIFLILTFYYSLSTTHQCCLVDDKFYPINKKTYKIHSFLDRKIISPIYKIYDKCTPKVFKKVLHRFNNNIEFILYKGINTLLQLNLKAFIIESRKFILSTVFGLGGIIDIKNKFKFKKRKNYNTNSYYFSNTLEKYGFKHKYYFFIPGIGPVSILTLIDILLSFKAKPKVLNKIYNILYNLKKYSLNKKAIYVSKQSSISLYSIIKIGFQDQIKKNCKKCFKNKQI